MVENNNANARIQDSVTFDLTPEHGEFKCNLEKGTAASICTYWNRFEVIMDIGNFPRENTKVTIDPTGAIRISASLAPMPNSAQTHAHATFDKIINIPSAERETILKNGFICQMNEQGILKIYASLLQATTKEEMATVSDATMTSNGFSGSTSTNGQTKTKKRWTISSAVENTRPNSRSRSSSSSDDITPRPGPILADFEWDKNRVQDLNEFILTPKKKFKAFINASGIKDLKISTVRNRIIRIQGIHPNGATYLKEIPIPPGLLAEDIDGAINRQGILRFVGQTDESKFQLSKLGALKLGDGKGRTIPLKAVIESSVKRVKTAEATPWGQRIAAKNISVEKQFKKDAKFEASVAAKDYAAKEIQISIGVGWITITGKKQPGLGGDPSAFTKKIEIPPHINPERLTFSLDTSNGSIIISVMD